ncbi:hypothetical protein GpartN1_g3653.t1 [Galdieria partita]|uniref:Membrane insertase YidC/Oxa/ALB C-terminal domain-containing protein n=1 Tax=Galdieria partita TaxID=83374 RepID=A0A9C7PYJ1_9RHOD|nr:hypothetical protein GpartN1_g3653.t1 [Galdieria partita]
MTISRLFVNSKVISSYSVSYVLLSTIRKFSTKPGTISKLESSFWCRGIQQQCLSETKLGKAPWKSIIIHSKLFYSQQPSESKQASDRPVQWKESYETQETSFERLPIGSLEEQSDTVVASSGIYDHLISFWQGYISTSANVLQFLYDSLGVPWFALIGITTITVRLLLLPVTITSMRSIAVMKCLKPQLNEIHKRAAEATSRYNDEKILELKHEYLQLMKKYKADPLKSFYAPFIQTPIIMSLYWGVKSLSKTNPISLSKGGMGWFEDLTVPDPHYILPLLCSTIYLITLRIAKDTMAVTSNDTALFSVRVITILCFPLTLKVPALIFCYLLPNSCFTFLLNCMLRNPSIRQRLGFPTLDGQLPVNHQGGKEDDDTLVNLSKAEREAMAALSYLKTSRYSSLLFAAKRGIKPRLLQKPKKSHS